MMGDKCMRGSLVFQQTRTGTSCWVGGDCLVFRSGRQNDPPVIHENMLLRSIMLA